MTTIQVSPTENLAALINASGAANYQLAPGATYSISSKTTLPDGIAIQGNGASITGPASDYAFHASGKHTFDGIKFRGSVVEWVGSPTPIILNCDFTAFDHGPNSGAGSTALGGGLHSGGANLTNGLIKSNRFHDCPTAYGIVFFTSTNLTIDSNEFFNCWGGIKCDNANIVPATNFAITNNWFHHCFRHEIESQGVVHTWNISHNKVEDQQLSPASSVNDSHFAMSIIHTPGHAGDPGGVTPSTNGLVEYNVCIGPVDGNGKPVLNLGIENGENVVYRNNDVRNYKVIATFWDGGSTRTNNHCENWTQNMYELLPGDPAKIGVPPDSSNGPTVIIGTQPDPTMKPPTPSAIGNNFVTLSWDAQASAGSYHIFIKTTDGNDPWVDLGPVTATSAKLAGLHDGWKYKAHIVAKIATGDVSSPDAIWSQAGDSTASVPNAPKLATDTTPPPKQRSAVKIIYDDGSSQAVGP